MTYLPDYETLFTEDMFVQESESSTLVMYVSGFLVGITVEILRPAQVTAEYITGELHRYSYRDKTESSKLAQFRLPWAWGYHKGGLLVPKPLQNMNGAHPYLLKISQHPRMRVTQISCSFKEGGMAHGDNQPGLRDSRMPEYATQGDDQRSTSPDQGISGHHPSAHNAQEGQ